MENKMQIQFKTADDVKAFVKAASECDFDIDVIYNRMVVDAKSILGVFSLGLSNCLTVAYADNNSKFENLLQKYAVA
ncbi:MAG: HPr family phosphocarrier protein [Hespellia sp.]|nr:HPr family phosphocarrier protein [Hespellia sp.]